MKRRVFQIRLSFRGKNAVFPLASGRAELSAALRFSFCKGKRSHSIQISRILHGFNFRVYTPPLQGNMTAPPERGRGETLSTANTLPGQERKPEAQGQAAGKFQDADAPPLSSGTSPSGIRSGSSFSSCSALTFKMLTPFDRRLPTTTTAVP